MVSTPPTGSFLQPQSQLQQKNRNRLQEFQPRDSLRDAHPSPNSSIPGIQRSAVASAACPTISIPTAAPAGCGDATELQQWDYGVLSHNLSDERDCCESPKSGQGSVGTKFDYSGPATTPDNLGSSNCSRGATPPPPSGLAASAWKALKLRSRLAAFWNNHMSVVVPYNVARDHLALERTYLAYHRTSLVFAIFAAITAQLTVIQQAHIPSTNFSFYSIGKPLSVLLVCFSLVISVLGVLRWWRLQSGLLRGVAIAGGLEVWGLAGGALLLTIALFGLSLAMDIGKKY